MDLLRRAIFGKSIKRQKELVSALDEFIQSFYLGETLSTEQAKANLESGLLEVVVEKQHIGSGLLITRDGFFITANHVLDYALNYKQSFVKLQDKSYKIERICACTKEKDMVLAKANIPGDCEPMRYKFFNSNKLDNYDSMPLTVMVKWDNTLITAPGLYANALQNGFNFDDKASLEKRESIQFIHSLAKPGYSGSVICTPDFRLMGLVTGGLQVFELGAGIRIVKALEVVESYKRALQRNLRWSFF